MRIGTAEHYFQIEAAEGLPGVTHLVGAKSAGPGWIAWVVDLPVEITPLHADNEVTSDLMSGKCRKLEVHFAQGGWLRLRRTAEGGLVARYRVCWAETGAALEGEIVLGRESAADVCTRMKSLLFGSGKIPTWPA